MELSDVWLSYLILYLRVCIYINDVIEHVDRCLSEKMIFDYSMIFIIIILILYH